VANKIDNEQLVKALVRILGFAKSLLEKVLKGDKI